MPQEEYMFQTAHVPPPSPKPQHDPLPPQSGYAQHSPTGTGENPPHLTNIFLEAHKEMEAQPALVNKEVDTKDLLFCAETFDDAPPQSLAPSPEKVTPQPMKTEEKEDLGEGLDDFAELDGRVRSFCESIIIRYVNEQVENYFEIYGASNAPESNPCWDFGEKLILHAQDKFNDLDEELVDDDLILELFKERLIKTIVGYDGFSRQRVDYSIYLQPLKTEAGVNTFVRVGLVKFHNILQTAFPSVSYDLEKVKSKLRTLLAKVTKEQKEIFASTPTYKLPSYEKATMKKEEYDSIRLKNLSKELNPVDTYVMPSDTSQPRSVSIVVVESKGKRTSVVARRSPRRRVPKKRSLKIPPDELRVEETGMKRGAAHLDEDPSKIFPKKSTVNPLPRPVLGLHLKV